MVSVWTISYCSSFQLYASVLLFQLSVSVFKRVIPDASAPQTAEVLHPAFILHLGRVQRVAPYWYPENNGVMAQLILKHNSGTECLESRLGNYFNTKGGSATPNESIVCGISRKSCRTVRGSVRFLPARVRSLGGSTHPGSLTDSLGCLRISRFCVYVFIVHADSRQPFLGYCSARAKCDSAPSYKLHNFRGGHCSIIFG